MTNTIVKVIPNDTCFSITWVITNKCNYDCMYCPAELHAGDAIYSLSKMQSYWLDIFNKTEVKEILTPYQGLKDGIIQDLWERYYTKQKD